MKSQALDKTHNRVDKHSQNMMGGDFLQFVVQTTNSVGKSYFANTISTFFPGEHALISYGRHTKWFAERAPVPGRVMTNLRKN